MAALTLTNYTDLQTTAASFLHRTDLTDVYPLCVSMTERVMNYGDKSLGVTGLNTANQEMIWNSSSTIPAVMVSGNQYVATPTDLLNMRRLFANMYGQKVELKKAPIAPMELDEQAAIVSLPCRYSVVGTRLYLDPIPNSNYTMEGIYYTKIPALSASATTNWVITNFPDVYLWGVLYYATRFTTPQNPDLANNWATQFKGGINAIQSADISTRIAGTVLRTEIPPMTGRNFSILTGI